MVMSRLMLLNLVLIISAGSCVAFAQAGADEVVVIPHGQNVTISSKGLVSVSVQSILVAFIEKRSGDKVTIAGAGIGETMLELSHKDGSKRMIKLRVESPLTAKNVISPRAKEADQTNPPVTLSKVDPQDSRVVNATGQPTPQPKPKVRRESPDSRRARPRRLQFSVEATFVSDSEKFPVLTSHESHNDSHQNTSALGAGSRSSVSNSGDRQDVHLHHDDTVTASRKLLYVPLTVRFSIDPRSTFTASFPFIRRVDEIKFSGQSLKFRNQGLGDIQLGFERTLPTKWDAWSANWGVGLRLPTGASVYTLKSGEAPLGTGHFEISGSAGVKRVFDPVVVRGGFGVNYALPRNVGENRFAPGLGHSFNTGVDYAASDRWVFSQHLFYVRRQNVFLTSPVETSSEVVNQAYLSHGFFFQPKRLSHAYRLKFDVGLNNNASDFALNFGYQW